MIKGLYSDSITLLPITEENAGYVRSLMSGFEDSAEMILEMNEHYLPKYENGMRAKYGFYTLLKDQLAGMTLLGIDSFTAKKGYTGADTFLHMRGKGVAPGSKPHLFYFGFEIVGLNRLATGCPDLESCIKAFHRKNPRICF